MSKTLGTGSVNRSARVHKIKRVIIGIAVLAVLLPSILCIILFAKIAKLEKQITDLSYKKEIVNVVTETTSINKAEPEVSPDTNNIKLSELNDTSADAVIDESPLADLTEESADAGEDAGTGLSGDAAADESGLNEAGSDENAGASADNAASSEDADADEQQDIKLKKVYLTFDDGPSSNTGRILDILNSYGVKGTFFVVGRLSDTTTPMYKRIVDEGHTIGMHSYTHKYGEIYASTDAFIYDIDRIQSLIYEQTGVLSKIYRFPGGSSNTVSRTDVSLLEQELGKRDITFYDWNVVSGDASSRYGIPKDQIVRNCTENALGFEEAVILMHDLPEKATTVEALPEIIEYFQALNVEIVPIDENTPVLHLEK